jgi:hypothetical protein
MRDFVSPNKGADYMLNIGNIYITPGALDLADGDRNMYLPYLKRHMRGDWGDVPPEDKEANDHEVKAAAGGGMLSSYRMNGEKFWIDTVGFGTEHVYTVVMLPSEY